MTLKLQGSTSGHTAIEAPASAGSNTLVLPPNNGTAGQILQTDGNGNLTWVDPPGIKNVDQWRLNADTTDGAELDPITNWTNTYTDDGVGRMGTSMGHSSGIFTFPSTGIWLIMGEFLFHIGTNDESLGQVFLDVSLDGSSYTPAQQIRCGDKSDDVHNSVGLSYTMDVTNTTNNKIKFRTDSFSAQTNLRGASGQGETMLIFIRLGDT